MTAELRGAQNVSYRADSRGLWLGVAIEEKLTGGLPVNLKNGD